MRAHRTRAGNGINIVTAAHTGARHDVAEVVVGELLLDATDLAKRQAIQFVVIELLDEAGRFPMLGALHDAAQLICFPAVDFTTSIS